MSLVLLLCFVVIPAIVFADNCAGRVDGIYDASCRSYLICKNGVGTQHDCGFDSNNNLLVFNNVTNMCDYPYNVNPPCGRVRDCSGLKDGRYTDLIYTQNCNAYYTCMGGTFFGYSFCPTGLVFNEIQQNCDWPRNVEPPCGTAAPTTAPSVFGR